MLYISNQIKSVSNLSSVFAISKNINSFTAAAAPMQNSNTVFSSTYLQGALEKSVKKILTEVARILPAKVNWEKKSRLRMI